MDYQIKIVDAPQIVLRSTSKEVDNLLVEITKLWPTLPSGKAISFKYEEHRVKALRPAIMYNIGSAKRGVKTSYDKATETFYIFRNLQG